MGWEGCWGDDRRGPDRPDTSRLFRAAAADQGDRTDTIGVTRDGAQGDPWPRTEFKYERGVQPAPKLGEWVEDSN